MTLLSPLMSPELARARARSARLGKSTSRPEIRTGVHAWQHKGAKSQVAHSRTSVVARRQAQSRD